LAIIIAAVLRWPQRKSLSFFVSVLLLILGIIIVGVVLILFLYAEFNQVQAKLLSLTPLTVIVSFVVWAYLFGMLGGLFSVPLTLAVEAVLGAYPGTRWIADAMVEEEGAPHPEAPQEAA
jgi:uncharacterized membrane protein YfcA